ncbi:MAG: precorrin-2 C(20)-methyltransferase [Leptolyngbyaceae cyanobacterium bins.349]|nr:precorrin-2 C(20)-methyltransferase [Leptolyngbyaceae cyanobacterium bins.349]
MGLNAGLVRIGTLYGISAGPGDPELLTVKALRILQQAAVVAYPLGVRGKPGFAEQIVAPWLKPEQIRLPLTFPYVQEQEVLEAAWAIAAQQVWTYLEQGQDVVFASEGDVSFYSTFTYLAQTLLQQQPGAKIAAIPGVCSPLAAVASLGLPLTLRGDRLVVLPALYQAEELEAVLTWADVVVLMKVSSVYPQVWSVLQRQGLLNRSYVVEWATLPQQVIHTPLQPDLNLHYFSLLIVHATNGSRN